MPVDQQPFIRCVQQIAFVVIGALGLGVAQDYPQVGENFAHVQAFLRGQRQIVGPGRAGVFTGLAVAGPGGIAVGFRAVDHEKILMAGAFQLPGCGQAGYAGAEDGDVGLDDLRRDRQAAGMLGQIAQEVAFRAARCANTGIDFPPFLQDAARAQRGRARRNGCAQDEAAPLHQRTT